MATYAIGDIQGCFDAFQQLLDKLNFDPDQDTLWLTGDLVNRGPKSLETLRFVRSLKDSVITVLGNHDLHLLAVAEGVEGLKSDHSLSPILQAADADELLTWLRHRPIIHYNPRLQAVLVHAGIPPCWSLIEAIECGQEVEKMLRSPDYQAFLKNMYGDEPALWSPTLTGWDRLRYISNALTRMRYLRADGGLSLKEKSGIAETSDSLTPWFEVRETPRDYRLLFGHWASLNGECDVHRHIALDTGYVWGGALSAYCLETGGFVRVNHR